MEVNEIMQRGVTCLDSHSSIVDASDLMMTKSIRHVPIMERGEVVGIVSDRDIRSYLPETSLSLEESGGERRRKTLTLRNVMQTQPIAVYPSTELDEVIDLLLENKVGAVLVVDSERHLRGIVSYEDILRWAREKLFE
jgi:CBS domain-containing protein